MNTELKDLTTKYLRKVYELDQDKYLKLKNLDKCISQQHSSNNKIFDKGFSECAISRYKIRASEIEKLQRSKKEEINKEYEAKKKSYRLSFDKNKGLIESSYISGKKKHVSFDNYVVLYQ
jgi:hypothetical protein